MEICPLCGSKLIDEYIEVDSWKINRCLRCTILYTSFKNRKLQEKSFYNDEYIEGYRSREIKLKERFRQYLLRIEKYKQGGRLLDIGCSLGYFLHVAEQSSYSWKVIGLEQSIKLIFYARQQVHGKIVKGIISKLPFNSNTFDCVTCFDVLEHDNKLEQNIEEMRRVLKKNGILVIRSPNFRSFMSFLTGYKWDWWAPPDHVLHFSFDFLMRFLQQNGFEILEKFTSESPKDFLSNIRGVIGKNYPVKALFYLTIPFLLLLERISWLTNRGALSFIIAKKK